MCQRVTCGQCGKPTFAGCGRHIEQVLGDVPHEQRCRCSEAKAGRSASSSPAPARLLNDIKDWFR
jgi:hypothetical protein